MFDPLANDSLLEPPAATVPVTFNSGGVTLGGVLHRPGGPGPHPIVVLLHGFPGNERNFDVAHTLGRAGYATVVFHYRGSWGMAGTWSWAHALADAAAVADAVREPEFATPHSLDPTRLALIGHSLGGFAALRTAAADADVAAVASIAGFNFGAVAPLLAANPSLRETLLTAFAGALLPLSGTSAAALVEELEKAGADWDLANLAPDLEDRPVLLLAGSRDDTAQPVLHHHPLADAFETYPLRRLEHAVFPTDHAFADHRIALTRRLLAFLDGHLVSR